MQSNSTGASQRPKDKQTSRLEAATRDFTARLKRDFAKEIASNPRDFKDQVLRLVRRTLPPKRGRPNDPRIDTAMRMIEQGNTVNKVLRSQITDFEKLDIYGRYLAEKGLRSAIARRRIRNAPRRVSRSLTAM